MFSELSVRLTFSQIENKCESITSRKTLTLFVTNDNIGAFKQKSEFLKLASTTVENFLILKYFDELDGDIKRCGFFVNGS